eukprot:scaffold98294_cov42-Prasinocladus_malaysianus.AAC.2
MEQRRLLLSSLWHLSKGSESAWETICAEAVADMPMVELPKLKALIIVKICLLGPRPGNRAKETSKDKPGPAWGLRPARVHPGNAVHGQQPDSDAEKENRVQAARAEVDEAVGRVSDYQQRWRSLLLALPESPCYADYQASLFCSPADLCCMASQN